MFKSYSGKIPKDVARAIGDFYSYIIDGRIKFESVEKCVCGSVSCQRISDFERFGIRLPTVICESCGLIYQKIRISECSMPFFYEHVYWRLIYGDGKGDYTTKSNNTADKIYDFMKEGIKNETGKILEIGCGSGRKILGLTALMKKDGFNYSMYGCDYSPDAIKLANEKGISTVVGDIGSINFNCKFEIIILSHILEHIPDTSSFLENLRKLCSHDTIVYVEVPGVNDLINKKEYGYSYITYCVCAHLYNFNASSLRTLMTINGFECFKINEYARSVFKLSDSINPYVDKSNYKNTVTQLLLSEKKAKAHYKKPHRIIKRMIKGILL